MRLAHEPHPPGVKVLEPPACGHPMLGGTTCNHDAGHRGRHSSVAWRCDACGKTRTSAVYAWARDGEYEYGMALCFMCASPTMVRQQQEMEWERQQEAVTHHAD